MLAPNMLRKPLEESLNPPLLRRIQPNPFNLKRFARHRQFSIGNPISTDLRRKGRRAF